MQLSRGITSTCGSPFCPNSSSEHIPGRPTTASGPLSAPSLCSSGLVYSEPTLVHRDTSDEPPLASYFCAATPRALLSNC